MIVYVPMPSPVVTSRVARVAEIAVQVPAVTVVVPVTLFVTVTTDPLVQLVSMPISRSVIGIDWLGWMRLGETRIDGGGGIDARIRIRRRHPGQVPHSLGLTRCRRCG